MAAQQPEQSHPSIYPSEEYLLRLLLDGIEDYAIYVLDPAGIVVTWNTGATRLKGYSSEEAIGRHYDRFFPPEARAAGKPQALLALAASAGHAEDEGWRLHKDGTRYWAFETYSPLYNGAGDLIGFAKATRDRTEHWRYEQRIGQLNRLYQTLSEINKAIVRERDLPALFARVCRIAVEQGGYRLAWITLIDPVSRLPVIAGSAGLSAEIVQDLQTIMQSGRSPAQSLTGVLGSGVRYVVEDVLTDPRMTFWRASAERLGYRSTATFALKVQGKVCGACSLCAAAPGFFDEEQVRLLEEMADDISFAIEVAENAQQRQQALQELRNSEERYRNLITHGPDAIMVNLDERIVLANEACARLFGAASTAELIGKSPFDLFAPEYHAIVRERIGFMRQHNEAVATLEEQIVRLDGERGDVEVRAAPFRFGDSVAIHVILHDITVRKRRQAELLRLNAELEERVAQRTAELQLRNRELETFTYSVSHDLKAPLRGIDGYSRLLEEDYSAQLDAEGRRFLSTIRRATQQMNQLIEDLLAYSRLERRTLQPVAVDPAELVHSLLAERGDEIAQRGVEVRLDLPAIQLNVDPEGLALALRNLLDNALKFTRTVAAPVIEIGSSVEDGSAAGSATGIYRLWVRDNGIGFDMKYSQRIFDIFQRLHRSEEYSGTGVGLAIVHKAIERMGGRSWANSEPGIATTFYLEVPLHSYPEGV